VPDPAEARARSRAAWSAGDYPDIAKTIEPVSDVVVEAAGVQEGDAVLDVATGSGNAALVSARIGAQVTGLDVTPDLLEVARSRAADEGLEITFEEGDAADLPYGDDSFDRVTSVFGSMFAPDHQSTAAELLRVCKPGGMIAVSAWTPSGLNGQLFATLGRHLPPPPEGTQPPILWGDEDHVRGLFAGAAEVACEVRQARSSIQADSVAAWVDYLEVALGPIVLAKAMLSEQGTWDAAHADLVELFARFNDAEDGSLDASPDYLLTTARA
jgi:SAM-dependent methyltransferase